MLNVYHFQKIVKSKKLLDQIIFSWDHLTLIQAPEYDKCEE
jgi:hypothetical protein